MVNVGLLCLRVKPCGLVTFTDIANSSNLNWAAELVSWLIVLCHCRDVWTLLEKPVSSKFLDFPPISQAFTLVGSQTVLVYMSGFDPGSPHKLHLSTTMPSTVWGFFTTKAGHKKPKTTIKAGHTKEG